MAVSRRYTKIFDTKYHLEVRPCPCHRMVALGGTRVRRGVLGWGVDASILPLWVSF